MSKPRKPKMEPAVLNVAQFAALMDINLPRAYEIVKTPGFPAIRIGKRIVIPKAAFERWLEQAALGKQSYGAAGNQ